jgi:hypothetical protein
MGRKDADPWPELPIGMITAGDPVPEPQGDLSNEEWNFIYEI